MNARQETFVAEYLVDLNAAAAARRAGYSPRTADRIGHENLRKPEIAAAIAAARADRESRVKITADYVLSNLTEVVERCMTRAAVMVREDGERVQAVDEDGRNVWTFNAKGALSALDLLGKHLGLWKDANAGPAVSVQVVIGVDEAKLLGTAPPAKEPARGKPRAG